MTQSSEINPRVDRVDIEAPYGSDAVAVARPAIGWTTRTATPNWTQAAADLELTRADGVEEVRIEGRHSVRLPWPFEPLEPREAVSLRVRTTGADGVEGEWSEPRSIWGAFLGAGEWVAQTIGLADPPREAEPANLRTEFEVRGDVVSATLYATAIGVYQAAVNGVDIDDAVLKPGWTPFLARTVHDSTDVTSLLTVGRNALGIRLAGAWATEHFGFRGNAKPHYGDQPRVAAQLLIEYADGSSDVIVTDASWRAASGPITASGLYAGESHDARRALVDDAGHGFADEGFDDSGWAAAAVVEAVVEPEARISPFVRRIEELPVREVITTPSGKTVLDFGQNLVGRLRLRVTGPAGTVITLRHAEVLEHEELGTRPLRAAAATDHYTLSGDGVEEWEPEFTFHGFRYAEVSGWPGAFDPADVVAVVLHSDMERTGWFSTSDALVDRLHENVVWGLRGNFLSVPTDCPQRDERLGWTGDIQVFAPTASFLYDVRGFLDSWLRDLTIEQAEGGGVVPFVVPNVLGPARPAAAWGDAATIVPWVLHERFADVDTLERQYDSMKDWVDTLLEIAGERRLWEGRFQFGDWLDPDAPPDAPAKAKADADLVATAYLYRSTDLFARAARLLGRTEDAAAYEAIAEEVRDAFRGEYLTPHGRLMSDAQTAYALAIQFDLAPKELHPALGARLAELTRESGYRISTGFVGTPIIQDALTETGHLDVASRQLLQTENPSWLYPVTMGATTVWERWDSMLPDGTINPGEMTSFNHYALGAVADWLHRDVAGLAPAEPGYARLRIAPHPIAGLDDAAAEHETPYGRARVAWQRADGVVSIQATVPANTTAEVVLPDGATHEIGSGDHTWSIADPVVPIVRGEVGFDSSLAEIIDDVEAYRVIGEVLDRHSSDLATRFRSTRWGSGRALADGLGIFAPPEVQSEIAERLAELSASRS